MVKVTSKEAKTETTKQAKNAETKAKETKGEFDFNASAYLPPLGPVLGNMKLQGLDAMLGTDFHQTKNAIVDSVKESIEYNAEHFKRGNRGEIGELRGEIMAGIFDPKSIWGKSADEVGEILGEGWEKQALNSGDGWKFVQKDGDGFVSYTTGNSHHPNSTYYKINSGLAGKNKVVGPNYTPTRGDKSNIFYGE